MSCGTNCARLLLIAFNFIFWLSGVAILSVGTWVLVDPNLQDYFDVIHTTDEEYFMTAAYILLGFGAFVFLVGFAGCCGAIRNSKCLLGLYIFLLFVVFGGELAAGILAAIYKDEIVKELKDGLKRSIENDYNTSPSSWDSVQKELKCCGGNSPKDYENSTWIDPLTPEKKIPKSCCTLGYNDSPEDKAKCQNMEGDFYHKTGCRSALEDWVKDHGVILIGVGCGIAALQIIGVILAICLCRSLNQEKY